MKLLFIVVASLSLVGCSVFGQSNVETAPYKLLTAAPEQNIEVRNYDAMVLVSTSIAGEGRNSAFRKLFRYIGGENEGATEIAMTAPVLMNNSGNGAMMSFVMPKEFTLQTTPKPTNPEVKVTELKNYKVAAIKFSGTLSKSNVAKHRNILTQWIAA
ncbi:heme-binding protein, partial [Arsukibacterium sp.]|uniref:SOUL family heme-binding protein n=1 Tax=Arsukibacterium sp. TaxID=1977258 RepID=UPI003567F3AF